ncbi:3-oxoacyl-[acyl-carrier-protein] synthase 3 [Clostridium acetireducens DSM 10703]|jgi:3-oxoacyl-[acyl-carrier-protein] synthase-3|uniref:Beta-ketoacyl-[acyl-carrier-protein] synthase III n=1 Tax=Clostridium acetireducens DSM 10703 TaxID=1121290 RepID=A0A1E8F0G3_9CLOT|nr:beta-ketoacyl-ACP synthase III [Clostridium acetireducens]OFI06624.1 3-oxoacyl-[acyl-carrier-protein] synthase 3 [Clostridium acetireducens DSM 10703]
MTKAEIVSTGMYVPNNIVTNDNISKIVDTNDEWIKSRTGISERRISINENTSDLATKAALKALKTGNINPKDIDLIIVATCTPDSFIPSTACIVQKNIKATNAFCFDIDAACSGFIYGVNIARQFIENKSIKKALIIGSETLSKIVDWKDRNTCILFGDGAGAVILKEGESSGIISSYMESCGDKGDFLRCDTVPLYNPYSKCNTKEHINKVSMEGREIFKFAVKAIIKTIKKVLQCSNYNIDDIKYIVPHQANYRIIDYVSKKLNIDKNKFYVNLDKYGNTSSASIPIALDDMNSKNLINNNDKIILVGFGGGLTSGGLLIKWGSNILK